MDKKYPILIFNEETKQFEEKDDPFNVYVDRLMEIAKVEQQIKNIRQEIKCLQVYVDVCRMVKDLK